MSKVTEATIQGILMRWLLAEKHHIYVLPNSNTFFGSYEADVISVTKALLPHEYEVKLNLADYRRDALKHKHKWIADSNHGPAYFWYVTFNFEIDPPEKYGWINVYLNERTTWIVDVKKEAERLNNNKIGDKEQFDIGRLLSWRIANLYGIHQGAIPAAENEVQP